MDSPIVHHLMLCRRASYELTDSITPYSLHHVVFRLRPPIDSGYPIVVSELWLFARLEGENEVEVWVEVAPLEDGGDDENAVATYGPIVIHFGSDRRSMSRAWKLRGIPFPASGWYEFRVVNAGQILANEWIHLEE